MSGFFVFTLVYGSNPIFYIGITVLVFTVFWVVFNVFDELLFFSPILYFYLPSDAIAGFILSTLSATLLGVTISMNIYLLRNSINTEYTSLLSSSFLTTLFSTCASCSSIGFVIISTFGSAGIIATTFLTNYQIPLRFFAIGILIFALYSVSRRTISNCSLNDHESDNSFLK